MNSLTIEQGLQIPIALHVLSSIDMNEKVHSFLPIFSSRKISYVGMLSLVVQQSNFFNLSTSLSCDHSLDSSSSEFSNSSLLENSRGSHILNN
ncbi:hypothetical protein GDO81_021839 [Engystomops pustulosus]|uniref:Uncharacterized protein n=1 Tax=Engystomops pustulosus TaxID=76066 RepID=A0AAV6YSW4_ENGPU|nr:hypothetical protein GDO81_021839 [Engystomops pustulosus]